MLIFITVGFLYSLDFDFMDSKSRAMINTKSGITSLMHTAKSELSKSPKSYNLNWQYAALCYFYGDFYEHNWERKKMYFTCCKDYAWKATRIERNGIEGHYWLAIGYAMWSQANGLLKSLFYADDIVREMTRVIEIQPNYFYGTPWALRATVYSAAPRVVSVGNKKKAFGDIKQALKYGANYRGVYQMCAKIYLDNKMNNKALVLVNKGLALPLDKSRRLEEQAAIRHLKRYKRIFLKRIAQ